LAEIGENDVAGRAEKRRLFGHDHGSALDQGELVTVRARRIIHSLGRGR
jgi:hypothetical protein